MFALAVDHVSCGRQQQKGVIGSKSWKGVGFRLLDVLDKRGTERKRERERDSQIEREAEISGLP